MFVSLILIAHKKPALFGHFPSHVPFKLFIFNLRWGHSRLPLKPIRVQKINLISAKFAKSVPLWNPKVADVYVVGLPDVKLGEVVLARIRLKAGETATEEESRESGRAKSPS